MTTLVARCGWVGVVVRVHTLFLFLKKGKIYHHPAARSTSWGREGHGYSIIITLGVQLWQLISLSWRGEEKDDHELCAIVRSVEPSCQAK